MMLSKDPRERPASALSVADGLSALAPDFTGLGAAAPMAEPDPFSLRPAISVGRARRQSAAEGTVLDGRPVPGGSPSAGSIPSQPAGYLPAYPPVWVPAPVKETPGRRPALVGAAVALLGLAALTGLVTVNAGGKHRGPSAALPFATESYQRAVVVSRTWSMPPGNGSRLHAVVRVQRVSNGGPGHLVEVLPWSVPQSALKASRGLSPVATTTISSTAQPVAATSSDTEDALQYAAPSKVGATATYTYDVATPAGAVTSARLQGWAVEQNNRLASVARSAGAPTPVTTTSMAAATPAISMTTGGPGFTLALSAGDTNGARVPASQLTQVAFSSDDAEVATVDAAGHIQPHAAGSTLVTARLGPLAATATILVTRPGDVQQVAWLKQRDGRFVVSAISGAPARPSRVTVKPGDKSALVVWSRPDDGGIGITAYAIYANGKFLQWADSKDSAALVGHLVQGRGYRFTVVAINRDGPSPASPPSETVTPRPGLTIPSTCVPASPQSVQVALLGQNTAHVTWAAPKVGASCQLAAIKITSYPYGRTVTAAPGATSVDIPGLNAVTQYQFGVTSDWADAPSQTAGRSSPVTTTSGACPDGSYTYPCPTTTSALAPMAPPITTAPIGGVTAAGPAPVLPVVTQTPTAPSTPEPAPTQTVAPPPAITDPAPPVTETTPPVDTPTTEPPSTASSPPAPTDTDTTTPPDATSSPADTSSPTDPGSAPG